MSVGLVLGGGSIRSLYTADVLDTFLDAGIKVGGVASVSADALFGVNFLPRQKGKALRHNKKYVSNPGYMGLRSWLKTGNVVNKKFAYCKIPVELDIFNEEAFEKSGVPLYVVVADLAIGEAEYHKADNAFERVELLCVGSALPLASKIVEQQGNKYLDESLSDSIPIGLVKSLGFDKSIVVLMRSIGYRKKPSNGHVYRLFYRKYPKFVEAISRRCQHYNGTIEHISNLKNKGELFAIRPGQDLEIRRPETNPDKYKEIYRVGIRDAKTITGQLRDYLTNDQVSIWFD